MVQDVARREYAPPRFPRPPSGPGLPPAQAKAGLEPCFKTWLAEIPRRPVFPVITADRRRRYFASFIQLAPAPQGFSPLRRTLSEPLWILFAVTGVLLGL